MELYGLINIIKYINMTIDFFPVRDYKNENINF